MLLCFKIIVPVAWKAMDLLILSHVNFVIKHANVKDGFNLKLIINAVLNVGMDTFVEINNVMMEIKILEMVVINVKSNKYC